jgi:hypothetical protein
LGRQHILCISEQRAILVQRNSRDSRVGADEVYAAVGYLRQVRASWQLALRDGAAVAHYEQLGILLDVSLIVDAREYRVVRAIERRDPRGSCVGVVRFP